MLLLFYYLSLPMRAHDSGSDCPFSALSDALACILALLSLTHKPIIFFSSSVYISLFLCIYIQSLFLYLAHLFFSFPWLSWYSTLLPPTLIVFVFAPFDLVLICSMSLSPNYLLLRKDKRPFFFRALLETEQRTSSPNTFFQPSQPSPSPRLIPPKSVIQPLRRGR